MATISSIIKGNSETTTIYIRLSIDRDHRYTKKSGFSISADDWSKKKAAPLPRNPELKNLKLELDLLKNHILTALNIATANQKKVSANWLQDQINIFTGNDEIGILEKDLLSDWCIKYKEHLVKTRGENNVSRTTKHRYVNCQTKIIAFEKKYKTKILVNDVNSDFTKKFLQYLMKIETLSFNTANSLLKNVKTICSYAKTKGVNVSHELDTIKTHREKVLKITLSFNEIKKIRNVKLANNYLDNARQWLVLGCNIGQRVSDLLKLTKANITEVNENKIIVLTQQKTGKQVAIPINKEAQAILDINDGDFPRSISDVNFNKYIKLVCKEAKINEVVKGSRVNPKTKRKEIGDYPKWELVSSHICRRSYATNYYSTIPTSLLISVTGHSTEKQFLEYVGKAPVDQALELAKLFAKME